MTQTSPGPLARTFDWLQRHPFVLPALILIAGAAFRYFNLNWDSGQDLHPDERWIFEVVSGANGNPPLSWPTSWAQFLSPGQGGRGGSPLDPHFFAYGTLPFYLLAGIAGAVSIVGQHVALFSGWSLVDTYSGLPLLARGISATLDLLSLVVLFLIGRRVFGYWTAVLAMALGAFTVLNIQLSHFYTVDTVLLPLCLLTLLAAVTIAQTNRRSAYVWGGVALGAALATKTTALVLVAPLGASAVLATWPSGGFGRSGETLLDDVKVQYGRVAHQLNNNLLWLLGSFAIAAITFAVCEPYALIDRQQLVSDIASQTIYLVTNNPPFVVPYTIQYAGTIPYLYQLKNLLFWDMGVPLGLVAFSGVVAAVWSNAKRLHPDQVVLLLWVVPYFLFVGRFFAKFSRYMLPIMPVMTLLGAALLVSMLSHRGWLRRVGGAAIVVAAGVSFLYALAFMNIYAHPNTRVAASEWIYAHIPAGSTIVNEGAWDDTLPLAVGDHSGAVYRYLGLNLYDPDGPQKVATIANALSQNRWLIMSSERMVGSIPKLPDRYPITVRYYKLLFEGKLGYRLIRVFQAHPQLGPIVVHDYAADESFHVYDHPIVRIFERVRPISAEAITSLLTSGTSLASSTQPPQQADSRLMLTPAQWAADQRSPTLDQMFPPGGFGMQHPLLVWLLVLEALGIIALPLSLSLFSNLVDRGVIVGKTIGLLVFGYGVWILVSLGVATYDVGVIELVLGLMALAASIYTGLRWRTILATLRRRWRVILTGEAVFLAGFALFVLLRMWYPDLGHQFSPVGPTNAGDGRMGEKQMELAFLNAIVRSRVFPPYDPFFAHGYINYYYYGLYLVGTLAKLTRVVPATSFNLAIATFFALLVGNCFSVGLNLTRRIGPGLLAAVAVGLIGNLAGAWQVVQSLILVGSLHASLPMLGGLADALSGLWQVVTARATLPPFDFWAPTRIVPPTGVISEFPFFTYLFADLHPHLIAFPMTVAALALGLNLALGRGRGLPHMLLGIVVGGVLLGAIAVTNPWDFPTYFLVVVVGGLCAAVVSKRRWAALKLGRLLLWLAGIAVTSAVLYLPFELSYQTVFSTGIGLVRDITPQMLESTGVCPSGTQVCPAQVHDALVTPLHVYLEQFGALLFPIASFLVALLFVEAGARERMKRWITTVQFVAYYRDRLPRVRRAVRASRRLRAKTTPVVDPSVALAVVILAVGLTVLGLPLLGVLFAVLGLDVLLILRLWRRLPVSQLFLLGLLVIPLALSIGTQIFFIKDWLAYGAMFRMNTIFKFYNQVWVLYAIAAAGSLYYFAGLVMGRSYSPRWALEGSMEHAERARGRTETELQSLRQEHGVEQTAMDGTHGRTQVAPTAVCEGVRQSGGVASGGAEPGRDTWGLVSALVSHFSSVVSRTRLSAPGTIAMATPISAPQDEGREEHAIPAGRSRVALPIQLFERMPLWSTALLLLAAASFVYTFAGTVARETYRATWLPEGSVPLTLDGMAFMKVAYPDDYAGISWLNAHVRGAPVIAEAGGAYYNWMSRVSQFTGLPDIINGIHEDEQRYGDETAPRVADLATLYNSPSTSTAWDIIRRYHVRYIYVGVAERKCTPELCYSKAGLEKFSRMVGHGLTVAFHHGETTIYEVSSE